jgi:hypothetical protein
MSVRFLAAFVLLGWSVYLWCVAQLIAPGCNDARPVPRWLVSIHVITSYLTLDAISFIVTIFMLLVITSDLGFAATAPVSLFIRYAAIAVLVLAILVQFPLTAIVRLLWEPFVSRYSSPRRWFKRWDGIPSSAVRGGIATQWYTACRDAALWMLQALFAGAVAPYLAVLTFNLLIQALIAALPFNAEAYTILSWLSVYSDWTAIFVTLAYFINMTYLTLAEGA